MISLTAHDRIKVADLVGMNEQYLYQVLTGRRIVSPVLCPAIECAAASVGAGSVPCEELRPDITWVRVPDTDWPWHPLGRPLIDATVPARQIQAAVSA